MCPLRCAGSIQNISYLSVSLVFGGLSGRSRLLENDRLQLSITNNVIQLALIFNNHPLSHFNPWYLLACLVLLIQNNGLQLLETLLLNSKFLFWYKFVITAHKFKRWIAIYDHSIILKFILTCSNNRLYHIRSITLLLYF